MIASSGLFALRTFAIYGRSWTVLGILLIPVLGVVASLIVCFDISIL